MNIERVCSVLDRKQNVNRIYKFLIYKIVFFLSSALSFVFFHDSCTLLNVRVTINMNANSEISDHLDEIYDWIDQIKFSRPKKNIARDFSDGGKRCASH